MLFGDVRYYHADRECRALGPSTLHEKTMCRLCAQVQRQKMVRYRLQIEAGWLDRGERVGDDAED